MKAKFFNANCKIRYLALLMFLTIASTQVWGDTYEQLTSIANIDESAEYVLGIDGTGFHYEGTSSWGKTALPSVQTPIKYKLTKAADGKSFTAQATISGTTYYLQIPTSNTFSMATSTGTNTDIIIGTTQVSGTNNAVANKTTTARHLRINGTDGLRSYAGTTGTMAYFYKVVPAQTCTITWHVNGNTTTTGSPTTNSSVGSKVTTLPTAPVSSDCDGRKVFVGWTATSIVGTTDTRPDDLFTTAAEAPTVTGAVTYYAVFATSASGTQSTDLTLNSNNLSTPMGSSYSSDDFTYSGLTFGRSNAAIMSSSIQIKAGESNAVWNKTALSGPITKIVVTYKTNSSTLTVGTSASPTTNSATISENTTKTYTASSNYTYFKIAATSSYTQVTSVVVTYNASVTVYSAYATSCCESLGQINGPVIVTQNSYVRFTTTST